MTISNDELRGILLAALSPRAREAAVALARLDADDRRKWLSLARQHRLLPQLHAHLAQIWPPEARELAEVAARAYKNAALRALRMQRELVQANRVLVAAGVPGIALKGSDLAFHVYAHPALRPLRDLDVLVPREQILTAWQALLDAGWQREPGFQGDPKICAEISKHLPPLCSATGEVHLELHVQLHEPDPDPDPTHAGKVDEAGVWARSVTRLVAGETLRYLSPTDLLLHLVVHAVYDHHFNNGPLTLLDVHQLMARDAIDWPLFWRLADEGGWRQGCLLLLCMVESHFGTPVALPLHDSGMRAELEGLAHDSLRLMLGELSARGDVALLGALASMRWPEKIRFLYSRAFPARKAVSAFFHPGDTPWGACKGYLKKYTRMTAQRLPGFFRRGRTSALRSDLHRYARLEYWLRH